MNRHTALLYAAAVGLAIGGGIGWSVATADEGWPTHGIRKMDFESNTKCNTNTNICQSCYMARIGGNCYSFGIGTSGSQTADICVHSPQFVDQCLSATEVAVTSCAATLPRRLCGTVTHNGGGNGIDTCPGCGCSGGESSDQPPAPARICP